jgi:flagellar hook-associated protein FlgK
MNSIGSIALSGMHAAQWRLDSAAHNIANLQTAGLRRQTTVQQALPGGGVAVEVARADVAGDALVEDIVGQKLAGYGFQANLLTLKTWDRMLGSLLDTQA